MSLDGLTNILNFINSTYMAVIHSQSSATLFEIDNIVKELSSQSLQEQQIQNEQRSASVVGNVLSSPSTQTSTIGTSSRRSYDNQSHK